MSSHKKYQSYLLIIFIVILYFLFAYGLDRTNFTHLVSLYTSLFFFTYLLFRRENNNTNFLIGVAFLFRLIFLFAIPNLSQDFYRFIWDGRMILEGFNPFISLPETFIQQRSIPVQQAQELYNGMGQLNGSHFTNYPPINQFNFLVAAIVSNSSILGAVIAMRVQIILADIGIIYFGKKLLRKLNLPVSNIFFYLLNPFIIIELTGNLHFEPVMLFFGVWSLYLLLKDKWIWSAIVLGCSVSVKLIPLILVPVLFQRFYKNKKVLGLGQFLIFGAIVLLINILLFLPFMSSELIDSYSNSVGLWFRNFEFNASIYYIAREIGYCITGYNEIAIIGKLLSILAILIVIFMAFIRDNKSSVKLFEALLLTMTFYYFTTTTVHPWYLGSLVLLGVFTRFRFPLIWSLVIILTYQAYANIPWQENLWLVAIEYLVVYGMLFWELKNPRKTNLI